MMRAIFPYMNSTDRYVVGGVAFSTNQNMIEFSIYANSTYDKCYENYDSRKNIYRLHEAEILHAVGNAINAFDIAGAGSHPR